MTKSLNKLSINTINGGTVALCYTEEVGVEEMIDSVSHFKTDKEAEKRCCEAGGAQWFNYSTGLCKFSEFKPQSDEKK